MRMEPRRGRRQDGKAPARIGVESDPVIREENRMNLTRTKGKRIIVSVAAVALAASMMAIPSISVSAQDAQLTDKMSTETLASVSVTEDGGSRLVLLQIALEPGTMIRAHSHSGAAVLTVISGAL